MKLIPMKRSATGSPPSGSAAIMSAWALPAASMSAARKALQNSSSAADSSCGDGVPPQAAESSRIAVRLRQASNERDMNVSLVWPLGCGLHRRDVPELWLFPFVEKLIRPVRRESRGQQPLQRKAATMQKTKM